MPGIEPQAAAPAHTSIPVELPVSESSAVQHHPVRREIVRVFPDWDLLPPSTLIHVRQLAR